MELIVSQDRESKLRDQVAALEEQVARLKAAEAPKVSVVAPTAITPTTNGYKFERPVRSESRASTIYLESRSATPVNAKSTRAQLASNGVWSSIHNPYVPHRMPNGNGSSASKRNKIPASPVESVVSTCPTVDGEGWWS